MEDQIPVAEETKNAKVDQLVGELDKMAKKLNEMDKALKEDELKFSEEFNDPIKF